MRLGVPLLFQPKNEKSQEGAGTASPKLLLLKRYCLSGAIPRRKSGFARTPVSGSARTQNSGYECYTTLPESALDRP